MISKNYIMMAYFNQGAKVSLLIFRDVINVEAIKLYWFIAVDVAMVGGVPPTLSPRE